MRGSSSTRSSTTREGWGMQGFRWLGVALTAGALAFAGCGGDDEETALAGASARATPAAEATKFPADSTLGKIQAKGEITIGVKFDVPPFGVKNPQTGDVEGFDVEMGKADRRQARRRAEVHRGDLGQPDPVPRGRHRRRDPLDDDHQRGARRADRVLRPVLHRARSRPRAGRLGRSPASTISPARTSARRSARPTRRTSRSRPRRPSSSSSTPTRSASSWSRTARSTRSPPTT